jgi:phosphoenolpyruvate carboxykinase (GTP)
LFKETLKKDYSKDDYVNQFTIRIAENLAKIERVEKFHRENVADAPKELFKVLAEQKKRLEAAKKKFGDYVSPLDLEKK